MALPSAMAKQPASTLIPGLHLDAVIRDAQPDGETKCLAQPVCGCSGVGVDKHRNNWTGRGGAVGSHGVTLSPANLPGGNPPSRVKPLPNPEAHGINRGWDERAAAFWCILRLIRLQTRPAFLVGPLPLAHRRRDRSPGFRRL